MKLKTLRKKAEESSKKELECNFENGQQKSAQMIEQAKKDIDKQSVNARAALLNDVGNLVVKVVKKYVKMDVSEDNQRRNN